MAANPTFGHTTPPPFLLLISEAAPGKNYPAFLPALESDLAHRGSREHQHWVQSGGKTMQLEVVTCRGDSRTLTIAIYFGFSLHGRRPGGQGFHQQPVTAPFILSLAHFLRHSLCCAISNWSGWKWRTKKTTSLTSSISFQMVAEWFEIRLGCQWNPWLHVMLGIRAVASMDKRQWTSKPGRCLADTVLLLTQAGGSGQGKYVIACSSWSPDAFLLKVIQLHFNLGHFS